MVVQLKHNTRQIAACQPNADCCCSSMSSSLSPTGSGASNRSTQSARSLTACMLASRWLVVRSADTWGGRSRQDMMLRLAAATYTLRCSAEATCRNSRSLPMVYVPNKNRQRGLNSSACQQQPPGRHTPVPSSVPVSAQDTGLLPIARSLMPWTALEAWGAAHICDDVAIVVRL